MRRELALLERIDAFASGKQISHALALTFGLDGDFAFDRLFRPLIDRYGVAKPLVLLDGTLTATPQTGGPARLPSAKYGASLALTVLRVARPAGSIFHPKLLLLVREGAVLLCVGSANLTPGGLKNNLELVTALEFSSAERPAAPRAVLTEALDFLGKHVRALLAGRTIARSLESFDEVLRIAGAVHDEVQEQPRIASNLAFVHSCAGALLPSILAHHGEDSVEYLDVVSPFYEDEDPQEGSSDSFIATLLDDATIRWSPQPQSPRINLYAGPAGTGAFFALPRASLRREDGNVALFTQKTSHEPRRLHAKLIAVHGAQRTTLFWGSANFTPGALNRSASLGGEGGNVECGLVLSRAASDLSAASIQSELELSSVFQPFDGELPESTFDREPGPRFVVTELAFDPKEKTLTLIAEVRDPEVETLEVTPVASTDDASSDLVWRARAEKVVDATWPSPQLVRTDPGTGWPELRETNFRVTALGADGTPLETIVLRVNVVFNHAFEVRQNILLGTDALSADALLMPDVLLPEAQAALLDRRIQERRDAAERGDTRGWEHHASLNVFYRNVRNGSDAQFNRITASRGSGYAVLRWSKDLQRSLEKTTNEEQVRRAYLVLRVSQNISKVFSHLRTLDGGIEGRRKMLDAGGLRAHLACIALDGCDSDILSAAERARSAALSEIEVLA